MSDFCLTAAHIKISLVAIKRVAGTHNSTVKMHLQETKSILEGGSSLNLPACGLYVKW